MKMCMMNKADQLTDYLMDKRFLSVVKEWYNRLLKVDNETQ
jgi:hypothetical protein